MKTPSAVGWLGIGMSRPNTATTTSTATACTAPLRPLPGATCWPGVCRPATAGRWTLDVGCGTGILATFLAEMGHRVIGVDLSPGMLAVARGKRPDALWTLGDAGRLPLPDGCLDALVARHLLWTLPQSAAALAEWRRALLPGGRALFIEGYWWDQGPARRAWGALARRGRLDGCLAARALASGY